ncbi:RHS repeat-associated core domain-containing protein [Pseudomonas floridensis]
MTLPTGQHLNHLYYGSGHLHQLNLDGQLISDMERDDLHREVYRTQGRLTSCFGYDPMGRKSWQFASTLPADKLSGVLGSESPQLLVEHAYNPIHRRYQYDPAGELIRTLDKLRGEIKYEYEANGQLHSRDTGKLVDSEEFRYDAAANRLNFNTSRFDHVKDNRLKQWRDQEYTYDPWGNLVEKRSGLAKWQTFTYDCENRLVKAETLVNSQLHSAGTYQYDSLGRRVAKQSEANGQTEHKRFLWQGLRMLREEQPGQSSLYVYEPGSYAPLARVDQRDDKPENTLYYFHTDQIGTPLEMTDTDGQIVWQATYKAWGSLEALTVNEVEQNLRFQGQYFDEETGLHYNTFRYYDPEVGRFVTQDPIGLEGGSNLYRYAPSPIGWIDPLGLCKRSSSGAKGVNKAKYDLERNGYKVVSEEVTIKVNGSRIRADIVAQDAHGNYHVFEVKHGSGGLTKNQKAAGVYNMSTPSNTTSHLGGGTIQPSQGPLGKFKVDTKGLPGKNLGGKGAIHDATFNVLRYW